MTRRSWIPYLILGLNVCGLSGCLFAGGRDASTVVQTEKEPAHEPPAAAASVYHVQPPPVVYPNGANRDPVEQVHLSDAPPTVGVPIPSVKSDDPPPITPPAAPDAPTLKVDKAPPDPQLVTALRDLLDNRSAEALEQLQSYDAATRDLLLTLLPLAARVSDGGLDHATPQETAVLLEQLRRLETVLRPRAALTLDKVCLCRKINGFGDYEPWPENHVFQPETSDHPGERMQVYVEVHNFTNRLQSAQYETSLAGVVEIRDKNGLAATRLDFPACLDHSQTPRQDYFVNFQFRLPKGLPEGRWTLYIQVKDVLDPSTDDAAPRRADRALDFTVGASAVHAGRD